MTTPSAYDAYAEWYEEKTVQVGDHGRSVEEMLRDLLGPGPGPCLDVCCGTGGRAELLRELGWAPVGVDLSGGLLGYAAHRLPVALGDASRLPVATGAASAVVCVLAHTDVADYAAVLDEVARVLRPGGRYVHVGVHPCFHGVFADRSDPTRVAVDERYADRTRSFGAWSSESVRARVGASHVPLADMLNGVIRAGLTVTRVAESGVGAIPDFFGIQGSRIE